MRKLAVLLAVLAATPAFAQRLPDVGQQIFNSPGDIKYLKEGCALGYTIRDKHLTCVDHISLSFPTPVATPLSIPVCILIEGNDNQAQCIKTGAMLGVKTQASPAQVNINETTAVTETVTVSNSWILPATGISIVESDFPSWLVVNSVSSTTGSVTYTTSSYQVSVSSLLPSATVIVTINLTANPTTPDTFPGDVVVTSSNGATIDEDPLITAVGGGGGGSSTKIACSTFSGLGQADDNNICMTWSTAWADTNYGVTFGIIDFTSPQFNSLKVINTNTQTTTGICAEVFNSDRDTPHDGRVCVIGQEP